jgi:hypothetical protein
MFGLFSKKTDPAKVLEKLNLQYEKLLAEARDLQRKGDIKGFAVKTAEAEEVMNQIVAAKAN